MKLLTDRNYVLTKEYLNDNSYLDYKVKITPSTVWN
jgi:hypothetical protein